MKLFVVTALLVVLARCGDGKEYATVESSVKSIETLMSNSIESHELKRRSTCVANQHFQNDCNTCKCSADGLSYRCTQNECMDKEDAVNKEVEVFKEDEGADHIERHSVCQPRGVFYIGCNTCHCNYYGTDYSCTNKPCPLPEDVELFHELKEKSSHQNKTIVCAANKMFVKDCNTCWCNEDGTGFFCTRRICLPELPEDSSDKPPETRKSSPVANKTIVCIANKMFVRDCNTCWCNDDGTGFFCTRRICLPEEPELPEDEGSTKDLRVVKRECRPGEVFEIECNMCRCNPDGMSFSCTRKACIQDPPVVEGVNDENSSPTRKTRGSGQEVPKNCQAGQTFRLDCNTCLCDNEGREFSCTRNDCRAENGGRRRKRSPPSWQGLSKVALNSYGRRVKRYGQNTAQTLLLSPGLLNILEGDHRRLRREVVHQEVEQCQPGSVFDIGCNVCRCEDDGKHATCTVKPCTVKTETKDDVPEPDPNFRCNPGEQFRRGCNDCTCSADGKSVFCTVRLCEKDLTPKF